MSRCGFVALRLETFFRVPRSVLIRSESLCRLLCAIGRLEFGVRVCFLRHGFSTLLKSQALFNTLGPIHCTCSGSRYFGIG